MWAMRNEAKHQQMKAYYQVNASRVNISYSLAMKICLQFASRLLNLSSLTIMTNIKGTDIHIKELRNEQYFPLLKDLSANSTVKVCSSLEYKGTEYKCNYLLLQETLTICFEIRNILIFDGESINFICRRHSLQMNTHLNAYYLESNVSSEFSIHSINTFKYFPCNGHIHSDGKVHIKPIILPI